MLITLLLAAAKPLPAPLMPSGPWVVRAEESMCLLERSYPLADGKKMSLVFQPLLDMEQMEVFVIADTRGPQQQVGKFTASIDPGGQPFTGRYYSVTAPKSKLQVTRLTSERRMLDSLNDGDVVRLQAKPLDHAFAIVRPNPARAALATCVDGLKKAWGIDPTIKDRAVTSLTGDPARWFGPSSYPAEAVSQGIYGRVIALLTIDVAGTVTNCRIVSSAGKALNDGTCKAAMRAKFKPPRDKDGQALPTTYLLPVRWILPGSPG